MNLLDFIFPKRCVSCGKLGRYVCNGCSLIIRIIEPNKAICPVCEKPAIEGATHPRCQTRYSLDGLTSFFRYDGVVKKAIKAIKYRFISDLASEFVSLIPELTIRQISDQVGSDYKKDTMMIPIPLHPSRARERGFNQAEVMGEFLSQRLNVSMRTDILHRTRKTVPQVNMEHREERLQNMKDVFVVQRTMSHERSTVILFDDVFTTGATMRSAANKLKRVGVHKVWGITMAR